MQIVRRLQIGIWGGMAIAVAGGLFFLFYGNKTGLPRETLYLIYSAIVIAATYTGGLIPGVTATALLTASAGRMGGGMAEPVTGIITLVFFLAELGLSVLVMRVRDSRQLVQSVMMGITDPLIVFDRAWKCVYVNREAEKLFGKNRGKLLGRNIREVLPDVTHNPMYTKILHSVEDNEHIHYTYHSKAMNAWLEANLYPSDFGLAILFMDISQKVELEKKLKESELGFKNLIDSNIIGVAIEEVNGKVLYANDVYLGMIGYSRRELERSEVDWERITPEVDRKREEEIHRTLLKKGSIKPYEKTYTTKQGAPVTALKGAVLLDRQKKTAAVFALDISKRSQREKRKDEFISIASHELKTPITSIKGFAQLLMRSPVLKNDEKSVSYLNRMLNQINRLTYLVNDILDVRRIEDDRLVLSKDFIDINQLVEDAVREVHLSSPSRVITWKPSPNAMVFADYNRVYQALLNILTNAIKYSPPGEEVNVTVEDGNDKVTVAVADRGTGIPREKQTQIFNKFFRVEENANMPGLGIGLFITSEIIKRHGGIIWVKSPTAVANGSGGNRKYGSTFYFSLPKHVKS